MPTKVKFQKQTLDYIVKLQSEYEANRGILALHGVDARDPIRALLSIKREVESKGEIDTIMPRMLCPQIDIVYQSVEHVAVYGSVLFESLQNAVQWKLQDTRQRAIKQLEIERARRERAEADQAAKLKKEQKRQQEELAAKLGIEAEVLARLHAGAL